MGIPNVGKSTLMNALVKKRVAAVGDEPAVTKQQQRIDLSPRQTLFDTPGLMWPKIEHDSDGYMLAASHAIGTNAVMEEEVATFLASVLLARYPEGVAKRYSLAVEGLDAPGVVEGVAKKRGCLIKGSGGEFDMDKASLILLTDYRSGALGRISLETPETRAAMLAATAASEHP
jgi:ribosome biogenesis GTPase A